MGYGWGWPGMMNGWSWGSMMNGYGYGAGWLAWLWPLLILDVVLRGVALWRAGRDGQKWWFVALLVVNSMGILPGIYLLTQKEESKKVKK